MLTILRHEINAQFTSLTSIVVGLLFLLITGLFLWVYPDTNFLSSNTISVEPFFDIAPWTFLLLIPATTMGLFSEEKRNGTLEILFTKPVQDWELILGKFGSILVIVAITLVPTLFYFFLLDQLGLPPGNVDHGALWGSYIGVLLLCFVFGAVGLFCSSLTQNQVISFLAAAAGCFILFSGFDSLSLIPVMAPVEALVANLGVAAHYRSMSRGVLDTRDLMYFISVCLFFLYLTHLNLASRKW